MQCPKCGYLMSQFDTECPRCKNLPATPTPTVLPVQASAPAPTIQVNNDATGMMGIIGIILVAAGVLGACFFFFIFNTAVQVPTFNILGTTAGGGYVNNLGLMSDRQNGILFSFGIMILGCFLFFMDRSSSHARPVAPKTKTIIIGGAVGLGALILVLMGIVSVKGGSVKSTFNNPTAAGLLPSPELIRKTDASSLFQVALAAFMYAEDHRSVLPDMTSPESFKLAVTPYLNKNDSGVNVFVQADTKEPFQPNSALSKLNELSINNPSSTVLLYQKTPYSNMTRNVAFADGHVKAFSENDWNTLKQQSGIP